MQAWAVSGVLTTPRDSIFFDSSTSRPDTSLLSTTCSSYDRDVVPSPVK